MAYIFDTTTDTSSVVAVLFWDDRCDEYDDWSRYNNFGKRGYSAWIRTPMWHEGYYGVVGDQAGIFTVHWHAHVRTEGTRGTRQTVITYRHPL